MTEPDEAPVVGEEAGRRCRWCRHRLPDRTGRGRPRQFCSQACRQWDWVARQRARELDLAGGELVMARDEVDTLRDELYVLSCAVDDVELDLADVEGVAASKQAAELRRIVDWLLTAARPLRHRQVPAPAAPPAITS